MRSEITGAAIRAQEATAADPAANDARTDAKDRTDYAEIPELVGDDNRVSALEYDPKPTVREAEESDQPQQKYDLLLPAREEDVRVLMARVADLEARLERVRRSVPGRVYTALRSIKARLHRPVCKFSGIVAARVQPSSGTLGRIERVQWYGETLELQGWALWPGERNPRIARVFLNDRLMGETRVDLSRPDIARRFSERTGTSQCGFRYSCAFTPEGADGLSEDIVIRFVDAKGREISMSATAPLRSETKVIPTKMPALRIIRETIAEFRNRFERDPAILDWDTHLGLAAILPQYAVFSPPVTSRTLPYLDHTVDIVVALSVDLHRAAETQRVASGAVVLLSPSAEAAAAGDSGTVSQQTIGMEVRWQCSAGSIVLPTASLIIPVHNNAEHTNTCLRALAATLPPGLEVQIIVVDDASTDSTAQLLSQWVAEDSRIVAIRNSENLGFIDSCNRGAEIADGDVLVFVNNDTLPQPGWLPPLLRTFREHPIAGAVGAKLVYPDGRLQEAGGVIFSDGTGANYGRSTPDSEEIDAPLYSFVREVDYCSGALLATRRCLFEELGGFDTRYRPAYYEDADYCLSLWAKGYPVYYQPESVIVHMEGATSGTDQSTGVKRYQAINRLKFVEKWGKVLSTHPSPPKRFDVATWHALKVRDRAARTVEI